MNTLRAFIGWDTREIEAYQIARWSMARRCSLPVYIQPLMEKSLRQQGLYTRKHEIRDGVRWDTISDAPMSTEFAITRFLIPHLIHEGWALFVDCDVLVLGDIADLFEEADEKYAVMVCKHQHVPTETEKMDGQIQTTYRRKNWSSAVLWNCSHPSNRKLTLDMVNSVPGRDLHAFSWLKDEEIGSFGLEWNYLVGVSPKIGNPLLAHYTLGTPDMPGYEQCEMAEKWWLEKACMAAQQELRSVKEAAE